MENPTPTLTDAQIDEAAMREAMVAVFGRGGTKGEDPDDDDGPPRRSPRPSPTRRREVAG